MDYRYLPRILRQEGTHFQDVSDVWRPTELLYIAQVRDLLRDMQGKYDEAAASTEELQSLPRSDRYFTLLQSMRLALREANFQWKANQVRFLNGASRFYASFGTFLRFLRFEAQRGTFNKHPANEVKGV